MKKMIFLFSMAVSIFSLSAQEYVFSYTVSDKVITKNRENTKAISVNRVLLEQIMSNNSNNFFLKIMILL